MKNGGEFTTVIKKVNEAPERTILATVVKCKINAGQNFVTVMKRWDQKKEDKTVETKARWKA